jgi:pimeloyl-ACP methyl ester carboxylesterase
MQTVVVDGIQIAFRVAGDGPPVVLIHAAGLADFFAPLQNSVLQRRARVISYHRIGYGRSGAAPKSMQIGDQARHCQDLLEQLGYETAHVVGHSSGGVIALELARRSPQTVATLSLLEPSLPVASSATLAANVMQPAFAAYLAGDHAKAIDTFLGGVCGPDYPQLVDQLLPAGARRQAADDAATVFAVEAPSVGQWGFDPQWLTELTMPVLSVLGERSDEVSPVSREAHELLLANIPDVEEYVLPHATHFLHLHNPTDLAEALIGFIDKHPRSRAFKRSVR